MPRNPILYQVTIFRLLLYIRKLISSSSPFWDHCARKDPDNGGTDFFLICSNLAKPRVVGTGTKSGQFLVLIKVGHC